MAKSKKLSLTADTSPSYREPVARRSKLNGSIANGDYDEGAEPRRSAEDEDKERRYAILSATVDERIREAKMARENSGIEEIWREDEDAYNGIDALSAPYSMVKTRDQAPRVTNDNRSKVFVNITCAKTDIGVARVHEMLLPTDDRPWGIEPTPIPEIDEAIMGEDNTPIQLKDGVKVTRAALAAMVKDKAREASKNMEDWIEDQFIEQLVYPEMRNVIQDAGRKGTGCLKGPFPIEKTDRKWIVGPGGESNVKIIKRIAPSSRRVRIEDCFPDPSCGDNIHNGEFFAERDFMTGKAVRALAMLPGYDRQCIVEALKEGPRMGEKSRDPGYKQIRGESEQDAKLFEVFYYYGDCTPEDLELLMARGNPDTEGAANDPSIDPAAEPKSPLDDILTEEERRYLITVPVLVTMLNGRPIKATLNPLGSGEFPYDFFVWDAVDGQPWGRGIPFKIATAQKILNASMRAMLENAGMSSGPQIVVTHGQMTPWDGRYEVRGRKGWYFTPKDGLDDVNKAMAIFNVPSMQEQMQAMVKLALDTADIITNMPMLMQGDQQAGTSPETLGGMKLLFNNAMSPLRTRARTFDDRLGGPHIRRYYDWGMEKGPANVKGDSQVKTKGSTALIQREEGREFLMQVFPVKDDPKLRIDPAKLIKEMARSNGFDMSSVQYTEEEWKQIEKQQQENPPPPDPTVQAAQIRGQALVETAKAKAQDAEAERQHRSSEAQAQRLFDERMKDVDKQLAMMAEAGRENVSLASVKAMLAGKAMDNRMKGDEMALKLDPSNQSHQGI